MEIKKTLFFASVLALLLFSTTGSAEEWELTFEDHPYDIGSFAEVVTGDSSIQFQDNTHQLYMYGSAFGVGNKDYNHVYIHHGFDSDIYFSFKGSASAQSRIALFFYDKYGTLLGSTNYYGTSSFGSSRIHVSNDDGIITLYQNNDVLGTASISTTNPISYFRITGYVYYSSGGYSTYKYYIDDFSTSPYCIGHKGFVKPEDSTVYFTVNTPVIDDYSYYVQMCDPNGAEIKHWDVTSFRDTCNYTPATDLTDDGLYYLYIYGQDNKLYYSKPFLFTSGVVPADMIFKASGTVNADVRDSTNQGGEIESGGERYLYMTETEGGHYPINVTLLEEAFSFRYNHDLVYAMHDVKSSLVTFEGLQSNYKVTLDGETFPPGAAATGSFYFSGNLTDGDYLNISDDTYEFDNEGNISNNSIPVSLNESNLTISTGNLLSIIQQNGTADISANLSITEVSTTTATLSLTANSPGTAGNLIPISTNATNISASGPYLTGGTDNLGYTNGASTWSYNITDWTSTEHIFEFTPDLTKPGIYGYVKDPDTQQPLRTATVTIFNDSASFLLWTDSNGMYYKTTDLTPGQYSVKAAKNRYITFEGATTTEEGATTRYDLFLSREKGAGLYYAPHDVLFTVWEYWNSGAGLPGASYAVYEGEDAIKTGITDSEGSFVVEDMDTGTRYKIIITYNEQTYTEFYEPGASSYTIILNKENIIHEYYNNWLNLTYEESAGCVNVSYSSNEAIAQTSLIATASNGTTVYSETRTTDNGNFSFSYPEGDYRIIFTAVTDTGLTASQSWAVSYSADVDLFPSSYPAWLKNILFVGIILFFLLAFGKARNDIACGSAAVLTSIGYYFNWLVCSFNFVILIWLISLGAVFVHYKRTKGTG